MTREQRKHLLRDARALLDWARWNTRHTDANSPHALLVALADTIASIDASHGVKAAPDAPGATRATGAPATPEAEDAPCANL